MQSHLEKDTVQDLYDEIEHLIDVPFEKFSSPKTPKDFHYKEYDREDEFYLEDEQQYREEGIQQQSEHQGQGQNDQMVPNSTNDYSFERPILIESDSDDIEEELAITPNQYSLPVCFKCDRPITHQSMDTLNVAQANNICSECSKKKRSRSSSFTFTQLADKLKQSFGHSSSGGSNDQLLAPTGIEKVDRRKSMPSMNSLFDLNQQQALAPPSPVPSRPSSRASSFIEDVKQFLSPLSRKSSRNSMHQEYQRSLSPTPPEGPKRKSSHSSLLDVINICKPSKPKRTPSYEKRLIYQPDESSNMWTQEDEEVMGVYQQQDQNEDFESNVHIPLRRKQIKSIESRQDRINIYNNAFLDCMRMETDLVPWIIKQTQKGPPDAWFGYVPPEREPKKIMGIFKRKAKASDSGTSLRVQQQQLGDELLNRSTPLLQHRYSNSNISTSPSNYTPDSQQEFSTSPDVIEYDNENDYNDNDEGAEYFDGAYISNSQASSQQLQRRSTLSSSLSPSSRGNTNFSPNNTIYDEPLTARPTSAQQPVSILKKSNSNVSMQRNYQQSYYNNSEEVLDYDDQDDEDDYYHYQAEQYHQLPPPVPQHRRRSSNASDFYQQGMATMLKERRQPVSPGRVHSRMYDSDIMEPLQPIVSPRGRSSNSMENMMYRANHSSREEDVHYDDYQHHRRHHSGVVNASKAGRHPRHRQQQEFEEPTDHTYCNDSIVMNKKNMRRNSRQSRYYDDEQMQHSQYFDDRRRPDEEDLYYQDLPPPVTATRRRSKPTTPNLSHTSHPQEYYGMSIKMTPYMMEEWEIALDDLCELYPRLDRHYINDFLRSAQGDFVAAKDMIMQMIMEIR